MSGVLYLHKTGGKYCQEDGFRWPCETYRAAMADGSMSVEKQPAEYGPSASVLQPVDVTFPAYRWLIILGWMTAKGMGQDLLDEVGEQIQRQIGTAPLQQEEGE